MSKYGYYDSNVHFLGVLSNLIVTARDTHWMSESGIIDIFLFAGPSVKDVHSDYAKITGELTAMLL